MNERKIKKGQSLVEFALIFPLFIFVVLFLFDFGRAVLDYSILNTAVREGTRWGAVHPTSKDAIQQYVFDKYIYDINGFKKDMIIVGFADSNKKITVNISYEFIPIFSGLYSALHLNNLSAFVINVQSQTSVSPYYQAQ